MTLTRSDIEFSKLSVFHFPEAWLNSAYLELLSRYYEFNDEVDRGAVENYLMQMARAIDKRRSFTGLERDQIADFNLGLYINASTLAPEKLSNFL